MTHSPDWTAELDHLAEALCERDLDAQETARFNDILRTHSAATARYCEIMQFHASLEWCIGEHAKIDAISISNGSQAAGHREYESVAPPSCVRPRLPVERILRHHLGMGIAVAAAFAAVVVSWAAFTYLPELAKQSNKEQRLAAEEAKQSEYIAWLNGIHGVKWIEGTKPKRPLLRPDTRLAISEGLVKIVYQTGAVVVLEGPADYTVGGKESGGKEATEPASLAKGEGEAGSLDAVNSGYLALGKLTARCDTPDSQGFTVETPMAIVTDLGTEFGVDVDQASETALDVSKGEVVVKSMRTGVVQNVVAGQFAQVGAAGVTVSTGSISKRFVYQLPERPWFSGDTRDVVPEGEIIIDDLVDNDGMWQLTGRGHFNSTGFDRIVPAVHFGHAALAMASQADDGGSKTFPGITLAPGKYTVTCLLGSYRNTAFPLNLSAELCTEQSSLADVLVSSDIPTPPLGQWRRWTLTYEVPPKDARIGETLKFSVQDGGVGNGLLDGLRVRYVANSQPMVESTEREK